MFRAMRIAIYTAITDGFDSIKPPLFTAPDCDYICFTDNPSVRAEGWQIRPLPQSCTPQGLDGNRLAKHPKVMPHLYLSDYDISIWIDGSYQIVEDFPAIARRALQKYNLACFQHPEKRPSVFHEAEECIRVGKGDAQQIREQIARYKAEGFNRADGIPACGVLMRRHMEADVIKLMDVWWDEISNGSERDQISFDYACWKSGVSCRMLSQKLGKSLLQHQGHGKSSKRNRKKFFNFLKRKARVAWYKRTL